MKTDSQSATTNVEVVEGRSIDSHPGGRYPDGLYRHDEVAVTIPTLQDIGDRDLEHFHEHGWIAVERAFTEEQVGAALEGFLHLAAGKHPTYDGRRFESAVRDHINQLTEAEMVDSIRKLDGFVDVEPRLRAMAYDPGFLNILRQLAGSEHIKMFQDMALSKPPRIGREKPWHQDCAYFNIPPDTQVVGTWIALDDVDLENGCMHLLDGGHKEGPQNHFSRRDWQICDTDIEQLHTPAHPVVAVPLKPGGCLFFKGLLPHGSPKNNSSARRRALQFHYYPASTPETAEQSRLTVFGGEGKGVEC